MFKHLSVLMLAGLIVACGPKPAPESKPGAAAGSPAPAPPKSAGKHRPVRDADRHGPGSPGSIQFHRGKYLRQQLADDGMPAARKAGPLQNDERALLQNLITQAKAKPAADAALHIIDQARELNSIEVLPLVSAMLAHADADVRGNALSLLEGLGDLAVIPVVNTAMKDSDAEVRLQAIEAAGRITSPDLAPILLNALGDADLSVRQLAFQAGMRQDDASRMKIIEQAVKSPVEDVAQAGVSILEAQPSKSSVPLLMDALSSPSSFIRERAHDILGLTFHENFTNTDGAKAWWQQNHSNYDETLVLKNP